MAILNLLKEIFHVNGAVIDEMYTEEADNGYKNLIIRVHLTKGNQNRDPHTGKKCPRYDSGKGYRRWRALDLEEYMVYIEAEATRVTTKEHGVVTAAVPWARRHSKFTISFENTIVWMSRSLTKSAISEYMRVAWNTVGEIISRVKDELEPDISVRWDNLKRIGIDETSYQKGHKYITVIVNHDTGDVIWAHLGHDSETLELFFKGLTQEQRDSIEFVSGDGAKWIKGTCNKYIPQATFCIDPFHCISWATEELDNVRMRAFHEAVKEFNQAFKVDKKYGKGRPRKGEDRPKNIKAKETKGAKYALGKAPENLTERQAQRLEFIRISNPQLYRAYLMKEDLRLIFKMKDADDVEEELDRWIGWAQRCRIPEFVKLGKKIKRHKEDILMTIKYGLSNARIEATNNKIKLIIRKAYGFRNMKNMLDMILLECSSLPIELPNRERKKKRMHNEENRSYYYAEAMA